MTDLYEVLGIPRNASGEEIDEAYRGFAFYPAGLGEQRAAEIQHAYAVLSDAGRRAEYDATLDASSAWGSTARASDQQLREPAAQAWDPPASPVRRRRSWNPVERMTRNLPRGWRIAIDWIVTIVGAIAIVLAIKAWVVNPYRIPSSSMEPTLHCARPGPGCEARFSDRVLANRFIYHFRDPHRGDIIVFKTPPLAAQRCGAGGTFVKRLMALPGETWEERDGYIYINSKKLIEPYIKPDRRDTSTSYPARKIPQGMYFMMGDNRTQSCDSREWGPVPRKNLIGEVFFVYWPPNRIGFR